MSEQMIECSLCHMGKYPHFGYVGSGVCDYCGAEWTYDETDTLTGGALERLWEKIPRWIPVSERLPDDETELLVAFDDRSLGVAFAVFHHLDENERPKCTDGNGCELKPPTHWMPLPEPPPPAPSAEWISHHEPRNEKRPTDTGFGCLTDRDPYRPEPPEVKPC